MFNNLNIHSMYVIPSCLFTRFEIYTTEKVQIIHLNSKVTMAINWNAFSIHTFSKARGKKQKKKKKGIDEILELNSATFLEAKPGKCKSVLRMQSATVCPKEMIKWVAKLCQLLSTTLV